MSATTVPTDAAASAPAGRKRTLLLVVGALVAAAAVWWFVLAPDAEAAPTTDENVEEGSIVALEPLTTTTGTDAPHHARVGIAVVLTADGDEAEVTARSPLLHDALLRHLAATDADRLRSSEGSDALRAELSAAAQEIWPDGDVARVVLTELLVQ